MRQTFCSFNMDHARDVSKLKFRKESVKDLEIFMYLLCVVRGG